MQKILIFGNGQLGNLYRDFFNSNNFKAEISPADITKEEEIKKAIENFKPDIIINTAAKTNVDWCELNKPEVFKVNTLGADLIADLCLKSKIYFVQISSSCIFESINEKPVYKETDIPTPVAFYSWTKYWAEQLIEDKMKKGLKAIILRPRMLLTPVIHKKNVLYNMLIKYSKFHSNKNSFTVVDDLLLATKHLIEKNQIGIFHITNKNTTTPYEIP